MRSLVSLRRCTSSLLAVLVVALGALALLPGTAAAHNTFQSSDPADGAVLPVAPAQITMVFAKEVPLETATLQLIDGLGVRTELSPLAHGASSATVVASLPALASGAITVRWTLVGSDGHAITGRVNFTVAGAPETTVAAAATPVDPTTPATTAEPPASSADGAPSLTPEPLRWLLRWASYLAIFLVVGLLATEVWVWRGALAQPRWRHWPGRALLAVAVLAAVQYVVLSGDIAGGVLPTWRSLETAGATDVGRALVTRMLLAGAVWLLLRMGPLHVGPTASALVLAGAALFGTWAFAGHPRSMRWPWLGVPIDMVHHAAAAAWVGALAVVAIDGSAAREQFADTVRRLSRLAPAAVVAIVVTGIVQTVRLHGDVGALLDNSHGVLLLVKVALVAVMLVLADRNRRSLRLFAASEPSPAALWRLRRLMLAEFAVGALVVGATAALVGASVE